VVKKTGFKAAEVLQDCPAGDEEKIVLKVSLYATHPTATLYQKNCMY
jgi:hypothetical protein